MCGLLGEFKFAASKLPPAGEFKELLALSKSRGPDYSETHQTGLYRLGFNRLAIQDLSPAGNQPFKSPSGRYHLVFNGEIYNFKDLAENYELKNLRSSSDTEVVAHLLEILGVEETLKHLRGMYSFGIIDTYTRILYLARDPAGIKPLFYGYNKKGAVFASQFNQVFRHCWFKNSLQLRPEMMKEYFGFGYMQAPNSIYQDIFQVKPGELLKVSIAGERKSLRFKELPRHPETSKKEDDFAVEDFQKIFKEVISHHLISDLPVGTFLSGGIDSPLVTAHSKVLNEEIEAFTLKVEDAALDESEAAAAYARNLKTSQNLVEVEENDLLDVINEHFRSFPEPFGDFSSIPTYLISREAKKKYTVMLSGDGADELFWGYPRMLDIIEKANWFNIPFSLRKPLNRLTNRLGLSKTHAPYHFKTLDEFILNKQLKIGREVLNEVFPDTNFSRELEELYKNFTTNDGRRLLQELKWNEFYAHLQRVLIKVDRTSMQNSMEVRVPFLDKTCINFSNSIEPELGIMHKTPKKVLRRALEDFFPKELIAQKKKGFSVPIENWFRGVLKEDLIAEVLEKPLYGKDYFDEQALKNYVRSFIAGEVKSGWGVWHIYAWQKWAYRESLL